MYIITTSVYPSDKATEVGKKYLEMLKKYPPDETLGSIIATAVKTTEQGIRVLTVREVKEGKLEQSLQRVGDALAMFLSIVGYEYSIDVYFSVAEALPFIGMSLPK